MSRQLLSEKLTKPLSTIDLILSVIAFIKTASIILAVTLVEFARAKQKMAEDKQAVAETQMKIMEGTHAIDKETAGIDPDIIIDEFLHPKPGPDDPA